MPLLGADGIVLMRGKQSKNISLPNTNLAFSIKQSVLKRKNLKMVKKIVRWYRALLKASLGLFKSYLRIEKYIHKFNSNYYS